MKNINNISPEEIEEMTGRVVFDKSPNSANKRECRLFMSGDKKILANIDRFNKYSEDLLSVDFMYKFKYTFENDAKVATIIDFEECTTDEMARESGAEDYDKETRRKQINDGEKFAKLYEECKDTFRGTIIHLAAQGKVNYITEKIETAKLDEKIDSAKKKVSEVDRLKNKVQKQKDEIRKLKGE